MPRAKPWLKLWVDSLVGPKSLDLSLAETGAWWKLYGFAHYLGCSGRLTRENDRPYTLPAMMEALHITRRADMATFRRMLDKQLDLGLLRWEESTLVITGYDEEQSRAPSAQKEAVRDRVSRWRAAKKQGNSHETVTDSPLPDASPQAQGRPGRAEIPHEDVTDVTALPSASASVSSQEDGGSKGEGTTASIAEQAMEAHHAELNDLRLPPMIAAYEEKLGRTPTPTELTKMLDYAEEYGVAMFAKALDEMVSHKARTLAYAERCMETWKQEGTDGARKRRRPGAAGGVSTTDAALERSTQRPLG